MITPRILIQQILQSIWYDQIQPMGKVVNSVTMLKAPSEFASWGTNDVWRTETQHFLLAGK